MERWNRFSFGFIVPTVVEYWYRSNLYFSNLEHQQSSSDVKTISNTERDIKRQAIKMWVAVSDKSV